MTDLATTADAVIVAYKNYLRARSALNFGRLENAIIALDEVHRALTDQTKALEQALEEGRALNAAFREGYEEAKKEEAERRAMELLGLDEAKLRKAFDELPADDKPRHINVTIRTTPAPMPEIPSFLRRGR